MVNVPESDPEARIRFAVLKLIHERFVAGESLRVTTFELQRCAEEEHVPEHLAEHVVRGWIETGQLERKTNISFEARMSLVREYEASSAGAQVRYALNVKRRTLLDLAGRAFETGSPKLDHRDEGGRVIDWPFAEFDSTVRALADMGLVSRRAFAGRRVVVQATSAGYDRWRDPTRLAAALPTSTAEDAAKPTVPLDVLGELVHTCDELLHRLGWTAARDELREGDRFAAAGEWAPAVGEYYKALESGLRYLLAARNQEVPDGAALRDLARIAAQASILPTNYQALFSFPASIRSPRSHGTGPRPRLTRSTRADAVLLGNLARTLLTYLAQVSL